MKKSSLLLLLTLLQVGAQDGLLDLLNLENYEAQGRPVYIAKDNTPLDNPITDMGATLGRVLFYDTALSVNDSVSCASCHQQENGFGDLQGASEGVAGLTGRHSMRLINSRFAREDRFFWDERADSLEDQVTQPIQDHIEMGFSGADGDPDFDDMVARISELERYQVLFAGVYGTPEITEAKVQQALAQFVRSIQSFDSRYDEGRVDAQNDGANFANYTVQENLGKRLFLTPPPQGGAGCAACHQPPEFDIDPNSGHNGIITSLGGVADRTNTRSPSLRDVVNEEGTPHGGFMHDASLATLRDVVEHYNAIPAVTAGLDARLRPRNQPQRLNLSDDEKEAIVAFLGTLTGENVYTDERWASPFTDTGDVTLILLPVTTELALDSAMVKVSGVGVPNVRYSLRESSDLKVWSEGVPVTASVTGELTVELPQTSDRKFYCFSYQP